MLWDARMTSTLNPTMAKPSLISFGEPKFHTDGDVLLVAFGKDGWLCSIEENGSLRKWNPTTGQWLQGSSGVRPRTKKAGRGFHGRARIMRRFHDQSGPANGP